MLSSADMTDTVRDGLLFAPSQNSLCSAPVSASAGMRRRIVLLQAGLAKQQGRRRSSMYQTAGFHVAPDTRALLESLADDAAATPALFVRGVLSAAKDKDRHALVRGLVAIVRDADSDSRTMAHALELALLLLKDTTLRKAVLDAGAFALVCTKVHVARENLPLVLAFVETALKHVQLSTSAESNALATFMQSNILACSSPSLAVLSIISNACKNPSVAKHMNTLPNSERFLRQILNYLSASDINFLAAVHSLQIMIRLTFDEPMGQRFFKDANINQIWVLVFKMLEKGSSHNLEPVLDLLEDTLSIPKFHDSLEKYVEGNAYVKTSLSDLLANTSSHSALFRYVSILLGAEIDVNAITECVLELDMVPLAFRILADIVRGDPNHFPDGGDALENTRMFLKSMLSLVETPTPLTTDSSKQLILQFGLSIRLILRGICDSFNQDKLDPEAALSPHSMLDAISLCDSVISCKSLRLRAENLVTVKLDRLVYFLAGFCKEGNVEEQTGCGVWGVEMVVAVLHLAVVASAIKGEELPEEVIDTNQIKCIIADSLRTYTHPHVISCCLNILVQCPSLDFFVQTFSKINSLRPPQKSVSTSSTGLHFGVPGNTGKSRDSTADSISGSSVHSATRSPLDQMNESLANLDLHGGDDHHLREEFDGPTPMQQLDEAERSLSVLNQLEKEVGEIAERMRKEMELKEAIAERKIAAHEAKALLLKTELSELKELLDEKIIIIRQLETSQSEAFRK
ncbi:hypothetical protein HDU98_012345, partial [Podochytrium sp. JEL0797]